MSILSFNPFKSEFTIVISIHYKPRIAIAILDVVDENDLEVGVELKKYSVIFKTVPQSSR